MNTDLAEHEAAHAVVAVLTGHNVRSATINPPTRQRDHVAGSVSLDPPIPGWPIPTTPTAIPDIYAAGYAWDIANGDLATILNAWGHSRSDRGAVGSDDEFRAAAARVTAEVFTRPGVTDAITLVAERMTARKSGRLTGPEIERVLARAGLIPAFNRAEIIAAVRQERTKVPA